MCLVACKTKQATPFLRLHSDGPLLEPLQFASSLLAGLDAAIKADLEPDRVTKVQILALMHLHNDGLAGVDRSSKFLSEAICEAWAMSLHWNIPNNPDQEECDFLWWSLRNFDRLNKCIMGAAPFIIDDTDVAIERIVPRKESYRSQLMEVAMALGDLMRTATRVYKASSTATTDDCREFPRFSDLIHGTYFDRFHKSHQGYLEIWYHVAAMLSCRYSGPGSVHYNRRLSSADRILQIISNGGHESLPPLPLVPYAMSMSTTVIYRALRDDQRDIDTAYMHLSVCCDALDDLSQRWTSATGVARLASKLTKRLWTLTKNGATNRSSSMSNGLSRINHLPSTETSTDDVQPCVGLGQRVSHSHEPARTSIGVQETMHANMGVHTAHLSHNSQDFQRQLIEAFPETDVSFFHIDRAFHDLFDYGMPHIFRDPSTWEILQATSDEEGFVGSG
jgi:hypothetical protein